MNTPLPTRAQDRRLLPAPALAPAARPDAPVGLKTVVMTLMVGLVEHFEFTEREQDVLQLVLLGRDNQAIARRLGIGVGATRWHVHTVFAKTGADSRQALIDLALRLGSQGERVQA